MAKTINQWFQERFGRPCKETTLTGVDVDLEAYKIYFPIGSYFEAGRWNLLIDTAPLRECETCEYLRATTDDGDEVYLVPYDNGSETGIWAIEPADWRKVKRLFTTGWAGCINYENDLPSDLEAAITAGASAAIASRMADYYVFECEMIGNGYRQGKWYWERHGSGHNQVGPCSPGYKNRENCLKGLKKFLKTEAEERT